MNNSGFEIERKFLIRFPDPAMLESRGVRSEISQTYLKKTSDFSERVRKRGSGDSWVYTHTRKKHVTDMRRVELEDEISLEEYEELIKNADPARAVIHKTRWCVESDAQLFEIDIYPFWKDRAVMEIELSDEAQEIRFPDFIEIIKEITSDKRYTNASLAKDIPYDAI